jgi:hypothetical protein
MEWLQWIVVGWFSLTFIIPFIAWNLLLIYCVESESPGYAIITTIVFILLIQFCSDVSLINWVDLNLGKFIQWGLTYIGIGVLYSIFKYTMYLTDKRRKFDRAFKRFCNTINKPDLTIDNMPDEYKYRCYNYIKSSIGYNALPSLSDSTRNIVFWMGYWPWSAIWTLLNNPIKWTFQEIKLMLSGLWKRLYSLVIGDRADVMNKWVDADRDGNNKKDQGERQDSEHWKWEKNRW